MRVEVADLAYRNTLLVPEERVTLGAGGKAIGGGQLAQRILIGGPVVVPITPEQASGADDVLETLATHSERFRFHMVVLGCTFAPKESERFERAWVQVKLSTAADEAAIGWSMLPERETQAHRDTRQVELAASLKFVTAKVSGGSERESEDAFVEALNILMDSPTWRFTRVHNHELEGAHRLVLVVRSPAAAQTDGDVRLRAVLNRKALGLLSYRISAAEDPDALSDDPVAARFVLPPS
jgi:hypothetical protein